MNTHYALLVFGGDFDNDHPDDELRGTGPSVFFLGAGPEEHCWKAIAQWTETRPLRRDETAEVVLRDPQLVANEVQASQVWYEGFKADQERRGEGDASEGS